MSDLGAWAEAWDEGFTAGTAHAERVARSHHDPEPTNPYRKQLEDRREYVRSYIDDVYGSNALNNDNGDPLFGDDFLEDVLIAYDGWRQDTTTTARDEGLRSVERELLIVAEGTGVESTETRDKIVAQVRRIQQLRG